MLQESNVEIIGSTIGLAGFLVAISSLGILAMQCLAWLRTGEWTSMPLASAWDYFGWLTPTTSYVGVQNIIDWCLMQPLSIALVIVGVLIYAGGMVVLAIANN